MGDRYTTLKTWLGAIRFVPEWWGCPHAVGKQSISVPDDFFGINIASASDAACDDYVLSCLDELDIQAVRLTLSPDALSAHGFRFIDRLIAQGLDIMLCLVPATADAESMDVDADVADRWREFVQPVWTRCNGKVSGIEIGSTTNRRRWSGFNYERYRRAWQIAREVCVAGKTLLAGPNVSDFEPFHNVGLLKMMGRRPADIHTDNLFVERVVEPEAYDHRVAGRVFTHVLKLNLVKKAWILRSISQRFGCRRTYCTYACWDAGRAQRLHSRSTAKKADYLVRYLVIAAASAALDRVYWGPLIGFRDCLIDDGSGAYPPDERVSRYENVIWDPANYTREPGYEALAYLVSHLKGALLIRGCVGADGISEFDFKCRDGECVRIAWTRDRQVALLEKRYTQAFLDEARIFDCLGRLITRPLHVLCERPIYFVLPDSALLGDGGGATAMSPGGWGTQRLFAPYCADQECVPLDLTGWRGALMVKHASTFVSVMPDFTPESLESAPGREILRDSRNLVWSAEMKNYGEVVVKKIRVSGVKRLSYRFRASKARRQWNNAVEMSRRGVETPEPIAFLESKQQPGTDISYYVCRHIAEAWSAREAFRAFREGASGFRGYSRDDIYNAIAGFLRRTHRLKVYHRDLSAGNLLMRSDGQGDFELFLIDVGRSRVHRRRLRRYERVADLVRLCHPMDEENRDCMLEHYARHTGTTCTGVWRLAFRIYDWKQSLKGKIRNLKQISNGKSG